MNPLHNLTTCFSRSLYLSHLRLYLSDNILTSYLPTKILHEFLTHPTPQCLPILSPPEKYLMKITDHGATKKETPLYIKSLTHTCSRAPLEKPPIFPAFYRTRKVHYRNPKSPHLISIPFFIFLPLLLYNFSPLSVTLQQIQISSSVSSSETPSSNIFL